MRSRLCVILASVIGAGCASDFQNTLALPSADGNAPGHSAANHDRMAIQPQIPFSPEGLVGMPWPDAERLAKSNGWCAVVVNQDGGPTPTIAYLGRRIEVRLTKGVVTEQRTYQQ